MTKNLRAGAIDVLGSVNVDLIARVARLPAPGETVPGGPLSVALGGKGANQAIAAARAGGRVAMWGAVGAQSFGLDPRAEIASAGVDVAGLAAAEGSTGAALIAVDAAGENSIVVSPGANAQAPRVVGADGLSGNWLLAQLELDAAFVLAAFEAAQARGATTVLNAAPAIDVPNGLFAATDVLIVNETELARYAGRAVPPDAGEEEIAAAAEALGLDAKATIVITLGRRGALTLRTGTRIRTAARPAEAVDTTGAGDCFCGALVARLAEGAALEAALDFAAAAAAISVTRAGAAPSMPTRAEIDAALG